MALTLLITSVLYLLIAAISVGAVPPSILATSTAPLSLVFSAVAGISPTTFNVIAVVSTLNTILAQITMTARAVRSLPPSSTISISRSSDVAFAAGLRENRVV